MRGKVVRLVQRACALLSATTGISIILARSAATSHPCVQGEIARWVQRCRNAAGTA